MLDAPASRATALGSVIAESLCVFPVDLVTPEPAAKLGRVTPFMFLMQLPRTKVFRLGSICHRVSCGKLQSS